MRKICQGRMLLSARYQSFCGEEALEEVADFDTYDLMIAAIVGLLV